MMDDTGETKAGARNIKTIENKGDTSTYQTIQLLHTTSSRRSTVTRSPAHHPLWTTFLDLMEDVSQSVFLYDIRKIPARRSGRRVSASPAPKK